MLIRAVWLSSRVNELEDHVIRRLPEITLLTAAAFAASVSVARDEAAPKAGSVAGTITVPAGRQVPEMVVFLEKPEAAEGSTSEPAKPAAEPPTFVISQKEGKFVPSFLVVPVGAKVEFRNDEPTDLEHNVFSRSTPKQFDLGLAGPKEPPKTVTFDKPGEVSLYCSVHRYMDATIYVTPSPHFVQPGKDGRFEMQGVPEGSWTLKTWQRRKRYAEAEMSVTVTTGLAAEITVEMKR